MSSDGGDLQRRAAKSQRSGGGYLSEINFLVVDDNEFSRYIARDVLKALGAKSIVYAKDGAEALSIVKITPIDIVLLDWKMPVIDGIEFTRFIRGSTDSPDHFLPIIMMTGYSELPQVMYARDAGVTEYLIKPVSATQILSRIRSIVENPRSFVKTKSFFGPDRRRHKKKTFDGDEKRGDSPAPVKTGPEAMDIHKKAMPQEDVDKFFGGANSDEVGGN